MERLPLNFLFFASIADISWQSAHIFQTPQFQIVECACHDDATQAQHRVGALSPISSCLGIGGHTGGSRHGHHGTPLLTQWEGRGWLDRTREHMAPEHATDTNEPKTDTKLRMRIR